MKSIRREKEKEREREIEREREEKKKNLTADSCHFPNLQ